MPRGAWWPIAIGGVLAVTVGANIVVYMLASAPGTDVVERDYYARAVAWDSIATARDASEALGWHADAALHGTARGAALTLTLRDGHGAPIPGARVEVEGIHNLDADHPVQARLVTGPDGRADVALAAARPGVWELRIVAERSGARFIDDLRVERTPS